MSQDDGRVALVSGGSHGIGAATVRRLAARGWDISFCYRDDGPSVRQVEKDASELGVRVVAIKADVTDPAQVATWFGRAEDELGPVAAMVSCAGITRDLPLPLMAEDDWRAVIDTGLDGVFHLCRAAISAMMKQRSGRIVAVTSVCGAYDHSGPGRDILARPGIAGFVKALAGQTARFGVSVNAVVPGLIAHDMADLVPERARGDLTETIAIRRFGDAAAVAGLVAFLLSEEAADITGTVLEARSVISLLTGVRPGKLHPGNRDPASHLSRTPRPRLYAWMWHPTRSTDPVRTLCGVCRACVRRAGAAARKIDIEAGFESLGRISPSWLVTLLSGEGTQRARLSCTAPDLSPSRIMHLLF